MKYNSFKIFIKLSAVTYIPATFVSWPRDLVLCLTNNKVLKPIRNAFTSFTCKV